MEEIEKARNSQLAREIEIALPIELKRSQQIELVQEYCKRCFVSAGMCADFTIHDKGDGNPHAHIMLTMRPFEPDGTWGSKSRKEYITDKNGKRVKLKNGTFKTRKIDTVNWNDQARAEEWRAAWAEAVNQALEAAGVTERVDHRSYRRQGVEQIPTIHLGVAVTHMERRGIATSKGDVNRQITADNQLLKEVRGRLSRLEKWLDSVTQPERPKRTEESLLQPLNLIETLNGLLNGQEPRTRWRKVRDLKEIAGAVACLQTENISTLPELKKKVSELWERYEAARVKIKAREKRLNELKGHFAQVESYQLNKDIYRQYRQEKPRKQKAFYENHSTQIDCFEAAVNYLKEHSEGGIPASLKAWKTEFSQLTRETDRLYSDMKRLRTEAIQVDMIRHTVERALEAGSQEKSRFMENKLEH